MSTKPELNYKLEKNLEKNFENNKVLVSLTLKVPIQFELELQTIGNSTYCLANDSVTLEKSQIESVVNASANHILDAINNSQLHEQLEVLSNHLANENKFEPDNSNAQEALINKKRKLRFADSLNDGLTFAANCVGAMLFMGKIANYSWE